jgi:hypothetical protein
MNFGGKACLPFEIRTSIGNILIRSDAFDQRGHKVTCLDHRARLSRGCHNVVTTMERGDLLSSYKILALFPIVIVSIKFLSAVNLKGFIPIAQLILGRPFKFTFVLL